MAEVEGTPGVEGTSEEAVVTDDAAALAAAAKVKEEGDKPADRPAWLPEKFKTPEEMATSYKALEQKQSAGDDTTTPDSTDDLLIDTTTPAKAADGIDIAALEEEYGKNEGLSDATYDKLAKSGLSRADADSIIEGRLAQGMQIRTDMATVTGGEEALQQTLAWAKANADKAELEAYNTAVKSKNPAVIRLALRGLYAGFVAEHGSTVELVDGESGGRSGIVPFENVNAMTDAMKDPRYKTSPDYRAEVAARVGAME